MAACVKEEHDTAAAEETLRSEDGSASETGSAWGADFCRMLALAGTGSAVEAVDSCWTLVLSGAFLLELPLSGIDVAVSFPEDVVVCGG